MEADIIKKLVDGDPTDNVSITLRSSTLKLIGSYKKKHKIKKLSPLLDAIIADWIKGKMLNELKEEKNIERD